jgi:hypothetical protein
MKQGLAIFVFIVLLLLLAGALGVSGYLIYNAVNKKSQKENNSHAQLHKDSPVPTHRRTMKTKPTVHAISFGSDAKYQALSQTILDEFKTHHPNLDINLRVYGLKDLPQWVHDLPPALRGYKWMTWKPVIALAEMEHMDDGDILYYTDGRSRIDGEMSWLMSFINTDADICPVQLPDDMSEQIWTRADMMAKFGISVNSDHAKTSQYLTTTYATRKSKASLKFLQDWQNFMRYNYEMCTIGPSAVPNAHNYVENRYDQSVFSLLVKTAPVKMHYTTMGNLRQNYHLHVKPHPAAYYEPTLLK